MEDIPKRNMSNLRNILVIGAHGKIGQILCEKLSETDPFKPTAFIRKEEQKEVFDDMGVPTLLGNLEDTVAELTTQFKNFDCIVFTAGSGGSTGADKTLTIDLDGAVRSMEAAENAGILRYIIVSASHSDDRDFWDKAEGMKPYYVAKHYADKVLRSSKLNYTILRPVMLSDDEGTGKITASRNPDKVGRQIPRADVASVIVHSINMAAVMGRTVELSSGDKDIPEALESILEKELTE